MPNPYSLTPVKPREPGRLFVLAFAEELTAFSLRETLFQMQEKGVIEVEDVVVATRNKEGTVRLHQSMSLVATGSLIGSFSGLVLGMLLLNPLFGSVAGAAVGATAAAVRDTGIDDKFMHSLAETLTPGSSSLFVLVHKTKPEQVLEHLQSFAGRCKVLQCNMSAENETLLRNLLEGEVSRLRTAVSTSAELKS
jgi:uncharacterized membrane protein